jgi:hypothetical protein
MKFGNETVITQTAEGSTAVETNFREGEIDSVFKRFTVRERVHSKKEEMEAYLKFTNSLDDTKLDAGFSIERSKIGNINGFYYVVTTWAEKVK